MPSFSATTVYLIMRGWAAFFYGLWVTIMALYHTTMITSDPLQLVLIGVVLESSSFFFEIPTGIFADSLGRRRSVIIGYAITGIAFMIEGAFPIFAVVLFAEFMWGVGFTFYSGANDAWIADEAGLEKAAHAYMRGTQVALIAGLASTPVAILLGNIALGLPIVVGGVGLFLLAGFLTLFMTEKRFQPVARQHSLAKETRLLFNRSRELVRQRPTLKYILLIGMTIGLAVGGFDRLYTAHFTEDFVTPPVAPVIWFGIISIAIKILTIIAVEVTRRRLKTIDGSQVIRVLSLFYAGTMTGNLLFALAGNFPLAVMCYLVSQTMREASRPLLMAWINQHAETRVRATVISMYWQSNALGQIFGAPLIGLIGTLASLRVALTASALAMSPALWFYRRSDRLAAAESPAADVPE